MKGKWNNPKVLPKCKDEDVIEMEFDSGTICDGWYEEGKFLVRSFARTHVVNDKLVKWRLTGKKW
jgi:hypothetical protein